MPAISTIGRLRQKYYIFKASLGYTEKLCKRKNMEAEEKAQQFEYFSDLAQLRGERVY